MTQPTSNQSVNPTNIATKLPGKPQRTDSAELIIRDLQNRVKTLENFISSPLVWNALPYNTAHSWGDYSGVGFEPGQYAVDALGFVHIRGLCQKPGTPTVYAYGVASAIIATLPVVPAKQIVSFTYQTDSAGNASINRTDIRTDGAIIILSTAVTATGTSNSGIVSFLSLSSLPVFQKAP